MTERSMVEFIEWAEAAPATPIGGAARPRRSRRWIALPVALVMAIAPLSIVLANHLFPDVLDSNPHHTTITRIAMAGITAGCEGTENYCPSEPVARDQMATFLHRGLGRAAGDWGTVSVAADTNVTVASLTITPGYASNKLPGANGFLKIDGAVTLFEAAADTCDCRVRVEIIVDGVDAGPTQYAFLPNDAGAQFGDAAITALVPVSANGARTVILRVNQYIGAETLSAYASLTALYVPFGSTGTDLLAPATSISSAGDDPE
jgi:hypothetical protein